MSHRHKVLVSYHHKNDQKYKLSFALVGLRSSVLQSIGNLTLVTGRHNSSMSNSPFPKKRVSLGENSILILNKEICDQENWDWGQIYKRTEELFNYFCKIWPSAENFAENIR